jgi:hypothetical protein
VIEVFGGVVSAGGWGAVTDQSRVAGVASTLPARSLARTENRWEPTLRFKYVLGEMQSPQEPPSSLHSKLAPTSPALKTRIAVVAVVVDDGPLTIVVLGGVVSRGGRVGVGAGAWVGAVVGVGLAS